MTRTVSPSPEQLSELITYLRRCCEQSYSRSAMVPISAGSIMDAADALESAQAEIARLTTALERIEEHYTDTGLAAKHMAAIARAALKDSPNVG
jgi:hypothetical protein